MINTLALIQLGRVAPSRFSRRLGGKTLLEWVVRQANDCHQADRVAVLVEGSASESRLTRLAPPDVQLLRADGPTAIDRLALAIEACPCQAVVNICVENPVFDSELVDRLILAAASEDCDLMAYAAEGATAGFVHWMTADAIRRASKTCSSRSRETAAEFMINRPEHFKQGWLPAPRMQAPRGCLRWDHDEDWEHAQTVYEALAPAECDLATIAGWLQPTGLRGHALAQTHAA